MSYRRGDGGYNRPRAEPIFDIPDDINDPTNPMNPWNRAKFKMGRAESEKQIAALVAGGLIDPSEARGIIETQQSRPSGTAVEAATDSGDFLDRVFGFKKKLKK